MLESTNDEITSYRLKIGANFLGILNDIKRRPIDASTELGVSVELIQSIIEGKIDLSPEIVDKATKIWPVNKRDFYIIEDDCPTGVKIMSFEDSKKSTRIMNRAQKPYYEYRDTAMSKVAPFRPEWIMELCTVNDNDPNNDIIQWNNGHFMHQFTYFIGNVNFYYKDENGKKQTAVMNTGDSMYITPFVPHTFATRKNSTSNGLILALTYGGKITGDTQHELSSLSNVGSEFALDFSSKEKSVASLLNYNVQCANLTITELSKRTSITINELKLFLNGTNIPSFSEYSKIANALNIDVRDLLPNDKFEKKVIIKHNLDGKTWFFPEETKSYEFRELASTTTLPFSKAFEVNVLKSDERDYDLKSGLHQFVYNIGESSVSLSWRSNEQDHNQTINPGDSLYMKPFIEHKFSGNGKLLMMRVGGKIAGESQRELSIIGKENAKRAISETMQWFEPSGKN